MKTYSLKFGIYFVEHSLRNPEHMSSLPSTLVRHEGPGGRKERFTAHSSGMDAGRWGVGGARENGENICGQS